MQFVFLIKLLILCFLQEQHCVNCCPFEQKRRKATEAYWKLFPNTFVCCLWIICTLLDDGRLLTVLANHNWMSFQDWMISDILCTVPLDRATSYQLKPQSLQLYITYIDDKLPRKTTVTKVWPTGDSHQFWLFLRQQYLEKNQKTVVLICVYNRMMTMMFYSHSWNHTDTLMVQITDVWEFLTEMMESFSAVKNIPRSKGARDSGYLD